MAQITIDVDDDYANDQRSLRRWRRKAAALIKTEQVQTFDDYADDERSARRLRRLSAKVKYQQSSRSRKDKKQKADDNYAFFLNFNLSRSGFQGTEYTDADPQYEKFLSFLKPCKNSYVLDLVKADGTPNLFTYEDDDIPSDHPKHTTSKKPTSAQEKNDGMLHHIPGNMMDNRKRKRFKSTDEPSETLDRSAIKDKMRAENPDHPSLKESLKVGSEFTPLKPVSTDSKMRSFDVSYQYYLAQIFNLKYGEKFSRPQSSKNHNIWSAAENDAKETSRKHTSGPKGQSGHMFDGNQGKKPRISQDFGKCPNTPVDAKDIQDANGDSKYRTTDHLRQKMESKHESKTRNCQNLRNSRPKTSPDNVIQKDTGMHASNDKRRKRHRLDEDYENSGRRSVAPKVDQEAICTAVSLRATPDANLGKCHRLLGYSEQATNGTLADAVDEDANCLHALHDNQSSGKKSCTKVHNQPRTELIFEGQINDSYRAFLSGLSDKEGYPVFQSEEGEVVTYEKDLTSDSDSDSDSVIIIGDGVNGMTYRKYCSTMPIKSCPQDLELDKNRTSKNSSFKKKLMKILRKPYDQEEYESLMEITGKRKPLEGYRDLRRGSKERRGTYELESLGKSYLDHHKDVAEAIKKCGGDCQKVLIILRGFMYWIEHVAHGEAFKPWMYKEYLEVQPRMSSLRKLRKSEAC